MDEKESQCFNAAYEKFESGDHAGALRDLRELYVSLQDPWDKTELLYHEVLWLLNQKKTAEARTKFTELGESFSLLARPEPDGFEIVLPISLGVMAEYAEIRLLIAEKKESDALQLIERLFASYPKQLSTESFSEIREEISADYGFILADMGRFAQAIDILKSVKPPDGLGGIVLKYLGFCYCSLKNYGLARDNLKQAFAVGIPEERKADAHYMLGISEYRLGEFRASKKEFQLCLKQGSTEYLQTTKIWEWLEETSRTLGEYDEAERYAKQRETSESSGTVN